MTADGAEQREQEDYRAERLRKLSALPANAAYPHAFPVTRSIREFAAAFGGLAAGEREEGVAERLAGRVVRVAGSSAKLRFFDLANQLDKVQIFADAASFAAGAEAFREAVERVHRGDILGVVGTPGRTKRGELSLFATALEVLSPCLHMLPKPPYTLKDPEVRFRQRYLDLIANPAGVQTFLKRAALLRHVRRFFEERGFVEVETPLMNAVPGGANARPFTTFHNELNTTLHLRVASELYLKQLVVGGLERVFEIGKNFRNEGIDLTHNPEFTAVEAYAAYTDLHDWKRLTEELVAGAVRAVCGSYRVPYWPDGDAARAVEIDFAPPWPTLQFVPELEKALGAPLPRPLDGAACVAVLTAACVARGLELPRPATAAKLFDKLCGAVLETRCANPAFIEGHPRLMSPLAKWGRADAELAERCELFVMGRELANFYTELNDPEAQRAAFAAQARDRAQGDAEAQPVDEAYCRALEFALPPTGGWGLGIDRLVMFLTNHYNIKEVILFPAMRPLPAGKKTE